ncbi:hypothetical protein TRIHO_23750 [Tritonibacter horizontis]|uniref:Uncharacterized protein n=1 Tax=Tritonibacter horizontis TaxID=1768241 RepID=A0A132BYG3_9RHOB|nr:hypothetical protein TRIHO_23750 [Tritonibacter horizontis]
MMPLPPEPGLSAPRLPRATPKQPEFLRKRIKMLPSPITRCHAALFCGSDFASKKQDHPTRKKNVQFKLVFCHIRAVWEYSINQILTVCALSRAVLMPFAAAFSGRTLSC